MRIVEVQLHRAATLLEPILDRMVFTGGAIRGLLVTDPAVDAPRPTDDIDTIIEVASLGQYHDFELELRKLGFKNDLREDAPICRYVHDTLTLDVMPTEPTLGFSNPWYPHAHKTAVEHIIDAADFEPRTTKWKSGPLNNGPKRAFNCALSFLLCTRKDLNLHGSPRRNLNPVRLPIPPLVRSSEAMHSSARASRPQAARRRCATGR